jgi:hypothetical protein
MSGKGVPLHECKCTSEKWKPQRTISIYGVGLEQLCPQRSIQGTDFISLRGIEIGVDIQSKLRRIGGGRGGLVHKNSPFKRIREGKQSLLYSNNYCLGRSDDKGRETYAVNLPMSQRQRSALRDEFTVHYRYQSHALEEPIDIDFRLAFSSAVTFAERKQAIASVAPVQLLKAMSAGYS